MRHVKHVRNNGVHVSKHALSVTCVSLHIVAIHNKQREEYTLEEHACQLLKRWKILTHGAMTQQSDQPVGDSCVPIMAECVRKHGGIELAQIQT